MLLVCPRCGYSVAAIIGVRTVIPLGTTMKEDSAQLDERKFALDAEIQRREIALKETEARRGGLTASQATIAGALLALISGVAGAFIAAWSSQNIETGKSLTSVQIEELKAKGNLDLERSKQVATEALERKKFETSLILEAIKTPSRTDAIRNLKFFVAAGFVADPDGKISKLADDSLPSIGTPSPESASRAIRSTGRIQVGPDGGTTFVCTGVAVSPQHVITASFCMGGSPGRTTTKVEFNTGERTYPLRLVSQQEQSKLALLKVDSTATLEVFLDRTRIRDPLPGERIYFALALANQSSVQLLTCEVSKNPATENDFEHNCPTGGGSAGAILIAVSDNALLGIHHSGRTSPGADVGLAAKLLKALTTMSAFLPPLGSSQPSSR